MYKAIAIALGLFAVEADKKAKVDQDQWVENANDTDNEEDNEVTLSRL